MPAHDDPITKALLWRKARKQRKAPVPRSRYASHAATAIALHFAKDPWPVLEIARYLQDTDPALKTTKVNTINCAIARIIRAERQRRETAE